MRAALSALADVSFFGFDESDATKTFGITVSIGRETPERIYTPLHNLVHMLVRDVIQAG